MTTLEDRLRYFEGCDYARHRPAQAATRPAGAPAPIPPRGPVLEDVRFWSGICAGCGGLVALLWLVIIGAWVLA